MNFLELQDFVMFDRFSEQKRDDIKTWLNHRYGRLWAMEPWTFKKAIIDAPIEAGESFYQNTTLKRIEAVWDITDTNSYTSLAPARPEDFWNDFSETSNQPGGFTVVGNYLYFDTPLDDDRTYRILGEVGFTPLVDDEDEPNLPIEFHITLAHGAISEGLRLEADPAWQGAEQDFTAGINDMKSSYLTSVRTYTDSFPAWP